MNLKLSSQYLLKSVLSNNNLMLHDLYVRSLAFLTSKDFWDFHGYGLSFLWLVMSTVAISIRYIKGKPTKLIHAALFIIIDYATLYLGAGVIYRYWGKISTSFFKWSLLKQAHAVFGIILVVAIFVQHIMGGITLYTGRLKGLHNRVGYVIHMLVGLLAIGGWMIKWKLKLAISCVFFFIMSSMIVNFLKQKKKARKAKLTETNKEEDKREGVQGVGDNLKEQEKVKTN